MTNIFTGQFTSDGKDHFVALPSGFNRFESYNETQLLAVAAGQSVQGYFRPTMANGTGINYSAAVGGLIPSAFAAGTGYFFYNNTINIPSAAVAFSSITAALPPLVNTTITTGLISDQSIVRLFNVVGGTQLSGMDFTVGTVAPGASFTLAFAPAVVATTTGSYRIIPYLPYMYPSKRFISKMVANAVNAAWTDITLTVTHEMVVSQVVRIHVPPVTALAYGVTFPQSIDGLDTIQATIMEVDLVTNTITVDVSFAGTFAWPLSTDPVHTPAYVSPFGTDTSVAIAENMNIGAAKWDNRGKLGLLLKAGANSPAGVIGDVISWIAYTSENE